MHKTLGSVDETLCVTIWEKGKEQLFYKAVFISLPIHFDNQDFGLTL